MVRHAGLAQSSPLPLSLHAHAHTYTNTPTRPCWGIHGLRQTKHNSVQLQAPRETNTAQLPGSRPTSWSFVSEKTLGGCRKALFWPAAVRWVTGQIAVLSAGCDLKVVFKCFSHSCCARWVYVPSDVWLTGRDGMWGVEIPSCSVQSSLRAPRTLFIWCVTLFFFFSFS